MLTPPVLAVGLSSSLSIVLSNIVVVGVVYVFADVLVQPVLLVLEPDIVLVHLLLVLVQWDLVFVHVHNKDMRGLTRRDFQLLGCIQSTQLHRIVFA
jgi:hypothetical protein